MDLDISYKNGGGQAGLAQMQARSHAAMPRPQKGPETTGLQNTDVTPAAQPQQVATTAASALVTISPAPARLVPGTKVVAVLQEETQDGYRRTRQFEQADGRRFTRSEEIALSDSGARRTVIQQNPSGSFTRYEEILERDAQSPEHFRRIQRFQDSSGETETRISENYTVRDPFILSGGAVGHRAAAMEASSQSQPLRGHWLDLSA